MVAVDIAAKKKTFEQAGDEGGSHQYWWVECSRRGEEPAWRSCCTWRVPGMLSDTKEASGLEHRVTGNAGGEAVGTEATSCEDM